MRRILYLLLCVCLAFSAMAKPILAPDDLLSVEDGLTQGMVRCVVQDPHGLMWFGTQDGLNRYDGHEFRRFGRKPFDKNSLSSDDVWSMHQSKHLLWVGTFDGLNFIDTNTGQTGRVPACEGLRI
jgi:ligand-binding sensor domain-containing protein